MANKHATSASAPALRSACSQRRAPGCEDGRAEKCVSARRQPPSAIASTTPQGRARSAPAGSTASVSAKGVGYGMPPMVTTLPSGSTTDVQNARACVIVPVTRAAAALPVSVTTLAAVVASLISYDGAPPRQRILPASYMTALPFIWSPPGRVPAVRWPPVPAVVNQFMCCDGPAWKTAHGALGVRLVLS
jgi:hypothetical protein